MVKVIQAATWEEGEATLRELETTHANLTGVWFRGQSDACWPLATTLDRQALSPYPVADYYRLLGAVKPTVETFSGSTWDVLPYAEAIKLTETYDNFSTTLRFEKDRLSYSFLAHLRHHGFPSPLLDWSGSMYVAAYFAFAHAQRSKNVAIFVYVESPDDMKLGSSGWPQISTFGPNVKAHKRHFRQQSRYTICVEWKGPQGGWLFVPHQKVFNLGRPDQDLLWKIEMPATERVRVLGFLDKFNLNAFSLFDTEESLMETLAVRLIDLKCPAPAISSALAPSHDTPDQPVAATACGPACTN